MAAEHSDRPRRNLIFQEGTSHKFWQIELSGTSHTVRYPALRTVSFGGVNFWGGGECGDSFGPVWL